MARSPREAREQKSQSERERYYSSTIRRDPGPTTDDRFFDTDSTEAVIPEQEIKTRSYPTHRQSPVSTWLREKGLELVVIGILVPLLGAIGYTLFNLNRELGELKVQLNETKAREEQHAREIERIEERRQLEINRLIDRLDVLSGKPRK